MCCVVVAFPIWIVTRDVEVGGVLMEASNVRGLEETGAGTSLSSHPEYLSADGYQCWIEVLT
jgi:hypothetical protein